MAELRPLTSADLPAATALLAAACRFDAADRVAEEKLFGPASGDVWCKSLGAFAGDELLGLVVVSGRWLRLLAVDPRHQHKGYGGALLVAAEEAARTEGEVRLRTLDQPGNYLAPGIALENQGTIRWLEKRGYAAKTTNTNLLIDVRNNSRVTREVLETRERALPSEYEIRRATPADLDSLGPVITSAFSAGWTFETAQATKYPPGALHVARTRAGEWAAFAAHDGNNRGLGWFGPTGTFEAHRGRGLGAVLLLHCLLDVAAQGLGVCTIAWIGPRDFYEKTTGIITDKKFVVLERELT